MNHATQSASQSAWYVLIGVGVVSTLLYGLGLVAPYPLLVGLQHPLASWATLAGYDWPASMQLACVYALLIGAYMLAVRLALHTPPHRERRTIIVVVGVWLLISLVLLGAYPGESLDIFDYLFRGRLQVLVGVSPLATAPAPFTDQPFYRYVNWPTYVDTYGPLWEYASGTVAALVGLLAPTASLAVLILAYRLLAISLAGLCGLLIYVIVRQHTERHAVAALLAWFWNPLLLTATAIGAHNDMVMLVTILGAVLLFQRQRWLLGLLALVLAAHVKLTGLLLLPVLGLWLVRHVGWRRALRIGGTAGLLGLPLSWLLYAPLGGWATLPRMLHERVDSVANSLAFAGAWALQTYGGWSEVAAQHTMIQAATLVFLGVAGVVLLRFWRTINAQATPNDALLWRGASTLVLTFLLIGSFWFWHWYLLWVLVLAALLPASRLTTLILPACCLGAIWMYIATDLLLRRWRPATPIPQVHNVSIEMWAILAVSAIVLLACWRTTLVAPSIPRLAAMRPQRRANRLMEHPE